MSSTEPKMILLTDWGAAYFNPQPSLWTLRQMARAGKIQPQPVKVGKSYYVESDARVVEPARRPNLVQRLQRA